MFFGLFEYGGNWELSQDTSLSFIPMRLKELKYKVCEGLISERSSCQVEAIRGKLSKKSSDKSRFPISPRNSSTPVKIIFLGTLLPNLEKSCAESSVTFAKQ